MDYLDLLAAILSGLISGMITGVYLVHVYHEPGAAGVKFSKVSAALGSMGGIPNAFFYFVIENFFNVCLISYLVAVGAPIVREYWISLRSEKPRSPPEVFERS